MSIADEALLLIVGWVVVLIVAVCVGTLVI